MPTAIITGASSGIGQHTARKLYADGYDLVLNARSLDGLKETVKDFSSQRYVLVAGDISDELVNNQLANEAIKNFSSIDVVIANAGYGVFKSVEELSREEFLGMLKTNTLGVFLTIQACLPTLRKQDSGQIIAISSMAGINHFATGSGYCASKWAVQGFMGSLKQELRDSHIKSACILPGSVDTPFFSRSEVELNQKRHLEVEAIVMHIHNVVNQPASSDLDEVVVRPAKK